MRIGLPPPAVVTLQSMLPEHLDREAQPGRWYGSIRGAMCRHKDKIRLSSNSVQFVLCTASKMQAAAADKHFPSDVVG